MITRLGSVTILVPDQEEALRFYTEILGFEKRQDDSKTMPGFRWLTVAPKGDDVEIVLAKPGPPMQDKETTEGMLKHVGRSSHHDNFTIRVFQTDDCQRTYETWCSKGVKFVSEPRKRPYGVEAIFEDLYGN